MVLEEHGGSLAQQTALVQHGDRVTDHIRLVQVVGWQQDGRSWGKTSFYVTGSNMLENQDPAFQEWNYKHWKVLLHIYINRQVMRLKSKWNTCTFQIMTTLSQMIQHYTTFDLNKWRNDLNAHCKLQMIHVLIISMNTIYRWLLVKEDIMFQLTTCKTHTLMKTIKS